MAPNADKKKRPVNASCITSGYPRFVPVFWGWSACFRCNRRLLLPWTITTPEAPSRRNKWIIYEKWGLGGSTYFFQRFGAIYSSQVWSAALLRVYVTVMQLTVFIRMTVMGIGWNVWYALGERKKEIIEILLVADLINCVMNIRRASVWRKMAKADAKVWIS